MTADRIRPGTVVRALVRTAYGDLVTLVTTSAIFVALSLPVLTAGASLLALVEVWTDAVYTELEGGEVSERDRARSFLAHWRDSLLAGLPYSLILGTVVAGTFAYVRLLVATRAGLFLIWTVASFYLVAIVVVVLLRAASIRARTDEPLSFRPAVRRALSSLAEAPGFTVLTVTAAGLVVLLWLVSEVLFVLVVPGFLAAGEVVAFEELFGVGAEKIRIAYADRGV